MGFNNCHIPKLDELVKYYNEFGLEALYNRFRKYDSWDGDSDAMNFLETKVKLWQDTISLDGGQRVE